MKHILALTIIFIVLFPSILGKSIKDNETEINLNQHNLIIFKSSSEKTKDSLEILFPLLLFLIIFVMVYEKWGRIKF
ncbi:hypothetical protein J4409_00395 [Candidatus Woesearchaeota archaeon]|nr:hypothetical protein [Candidatus Woesearchaeota archaeon]